MQREQHSAIGTVECKVRLLSQLRSFVRSFVGSFVVRSLSSCARTALLSLLLCSLCYCTVFAAVLSLCCCTLLSPSACAGSNANDTGRLKLVKSHKRSHHTAPPKMRPPPSLSLSLTLSQLSFLLSLCVAAAYSRHALCSLTYKNTATTTTATAAATATLQHGKCCCCCDALRKFSLLIVSARLLRTQQSYQHTHDEHTQHTRTHTTPSAAAAVVAYLILL